MISAILVLCCLFVGAVLYQRSKKRENGRSIPGPNQFMTLQNLATHRFKGFHKWVEQLGQTYGDIVSFSILDKTFVFLNNERLIKKALVDDGVKDFLWERPPSIFRDRLIPNDILFSCNKDEQHAMRKIFHKSLSVYGDGVSKFESVVCKELEVLCQRIENQKGVDFCMFDFIKDSLSNLISVLVSILPSIFEHQFTIEIRHYTHAMNILYFLVSRRSIFINAFVY